MEDTTVQSPYQYYQFWDGFYKGDSYETDAFFRMLLDPLHLQERYGQPVNIISVFSPHPWPGNERAEHLEHLERRDRTAEGIAIAWSGEEPYDTRTGRYSASLVMRPTDLSKGIICMPLFIMTSYVANLWPLYAVPRPLGEKKHFCLFVVSNPRCDARNRFFYKLSRYRPVHSCGPALNNTGILAPRAREEYFRFISSFRFMICFENTDRTPEYLTEKLHNAWAGGAIPIYWGASKAREWLNPNAFLYLEGDSEDAMDRLVEQVIALDQDEEAYRRMHAQPLLRSEGIPKELSIGHIRQRLDDAIAHAMGHGGPPI